MAHFVNETKDIVTEAIDGILAGSGGRLARIDGYPHIRVVLRHNWKKSQVALVSGGGSGHEPAHAGFIGEGMLTAAICGDIFASPSVDAVLAGILAVAGPAGCLLIVKNYTGDRLNFGLAAERARSLGHKVEVVIVGDDIALPNLPQPRGVAGTLLVHKIAGALAQSGADLSTVAAAARRVADGTMSFGMSLDTCAVPGSPKEARIPPGKVELGLGIHGEPGVQQVDFGGARTAVAAIADRMADRMRDQPHVALVNNLGGTSVLEMSVILNELKLSRLGHNLSHVIGPAAMMTSLGMHGFSVSIYPASAEELDFLTAATSLSAWPGVSSVQAVQVAAMPEGIAPIEFAPSVNIAVRTMLMGCCETMIASREDLNALDAKSGDGDTGSTVARAAEALLSTIDRLPFADPAQLCRAIAQELGQTMGGSSGILVSIFFAATADALTTGLPIPEALQAGLGRMKEIGGAKPGDRTLVDALEPALTALVDGILPAAKAARAGADHTKSLLKASAGRAAYVSAPQLQGHTDPGAEAIARVFEYLASLPSVD